jgi:hypothetical protein
MQYIYCFIQNQLDISERCPVRKRILWGSGRIDCKLLRCYNCKCLNMFKFYFLNLDTKRGEFTNYFCCVGFYEYILFGRLFSPHKHYWMGYECLFASCKLGTLIFGVLWLQLSCILQRILNQNFSLCKGKLSMRWGQEDSCCVWQNKLYQLKRLRG